MTNELVKLDVTELEGIETSKAQQIKAIFEPMAKMLEKFEDGYKNIILESEKGITKDVISKAKRMRLDIAKIRIETEKARKEQKDYYLKAGKAIDGVSNILKWAVSGKEEKLKEIEDFFDKQEEKRLADLQGKRVSEIIKYLPNANEIKFSEMADDVWSAYFTAKKKEYDDRIEAERMAKEEAEKKAKAEKEEQEKIKAENDRLKKEKEEADKILEAEKQKIIDLENEIKAKKEAEERAKKEAEEVELLKGDAEKLSDMIDDFENIKNKYSFKSQKNIKMFEDVKILIDKTIIHIKK